jgi:hypothetical protein
MKFGQVDGFVVFSELQNILVQILDYDPTLKYDSSKYFDYDLATHLESLSALLNQWLVWVVDMALIGKLV